jgi:UDP-glucose:(heptosyl)LPS alpha-1,3-glucosyltransferase
MKVLISRKDLRDTTSGVPRIILQELEFFKSMGHDGYAIAESINREIVLESGGVPVKTLKWPFSGFFRRKFYQKQVASWIKKNKPDLVIGHGDILHQDVLFIHNCVHLAHELIEGKPLPEDHEVGKVHTEIFTNGTFKVLVANSLMMKNDLVQRFKISPDKIIVQYPEFNLARFEIHKPESSKKEWREKFGFSESDIVIGMVTSGNFKKRNLALLIEAFKIVSAREPRLRLFVAGRNIDQHYIDSAPKEISIFAPAIIDVKYYYNLLDLFILPAHIEEFGLSVLEAMFCGVPVITTKFVGASEIIKGTGRDYIMQETNLETLIHKIETIINLDDPKVLIEENRKSALELAAKVQNNTFGETLKKFDFHF